MKKQEFKKSIKELELDLMECAYEDFKDKANILVKNIGEIRLKQLSGEKISNDIFLKKCKEFNTIVKVVKNLEFLEPTLKETVQEKIKRERGKYGNN